MKQNTQEWKNFRSLKIGSSDAPSIMGIGFNTPYQLWRIKMGFEDVKENFAMKRGKNLEPFARDEFIKKTGINVFPKVLQHKKYEWMIASLDGISLDEKHVVEIKCSGKEDHSLARKGKVPEKYYPQLQHQMAVVGIDSISYYSFHESDSAHVRVDRDDEYIKRLIEKEFEFLRCLKEFSPPKLSDKDYVQQNDEEWGKLAEELKKCKQELERNKKKEKELLENLVAKSNGQNSVGFGIRLNKICRKGNINYAKIPELKDIDLEQYRGSSVEYWRVSSD